MYIDFLPKELRTIFLTHLRNYERTVLNGSSNINDLQLYIYDLLFYGETNLLYTSSVQYPENIASAVMSGLPRIVSYVFTMLERNQVSYVPTILFLKTIGRTGYTYLLNHPMFDRVFDNYHIQKGFHELCNINPTGIERIAECLCKESFITDWNQSMLAADLPTLKILRKHLGPCSSTVYIRHYWGSDRVVRFTYLDEDGLKANYSQSAKEYLLFNMHLSSTTIKDLVTKFNITTCTDIVHGKSTLTDITQRQELLRSLGVVLSN